MLDTRPPECWVMSLGVPVQIGGQSDSLTSQSPQPRTRLIIER